MREPNSFPPFRMKESALTDEFKLFNWKMAPKVPSGGGPVPNRFAFGDIRASENVGLASTHTADSAPLSFATAAPQKQNEPAESRAEFLDDPLVGPKLLTKASGNDLHVNGYFRFILSFCSPAKNFASLPIGAMLVV